MLQKHYDCDCDYDYDRKIKINAPSISLLKKAENVSMDLCSLGLWDCSAIMAFAGYIGCHYLSLCPKYITSNLSKKWEHPHDTTTITLMSPSLSQAAPCQALSFLNRSR